ncbi:MAG: Holliday junction branch migration protein RuvA [Clostridia bacterium]|nr:Holliday junction branch migration protein RuvA [Clostridia bacterium]
MFYYLKGTLVVVDQSFAVIDCGGVGYKLSVSATTLSKIAGNIGQVTTLYTYLSVREDAVELMGFYSNEELSAFKMLISVSGVGPKAAMAILSIMTPERFAFTVSSGDSKALAKANGVGGKTAARIILELKDKVAKEISAVDTETGETFAPIPQTGVVTEAISALMVLGYSRSEAERALSGLNLNDTLEHVITAALKKMGTRF